MPRILIVDDEPAICRLLAKTFSRAGYEARTAGNPDDAVSFCLAESFDVLLADVQMPRVNGHELVRWVNAKYPSTRCVLMTAFDDTDCHDCPYLSRCRVLGKPFDPKHAVAIVAEVLEGPDAGIFG